MITLRDVHEDDLEMLREHRNRWDTRCWLGDANPITPEAQRSWWALLRERAAGYKIACVSAYDVGLVRVRKAPPLSSSGGSMVGLGDLYSVGSDVFAAHRGFGHGRYVFDAACALARELGARELWLKVFVENARAVRIYTQAGFTFAPNMPVDVHCRTLPGEQRPSLPEWKSRGW